VNIAILVVLSIAALIVVPLAVIWALNTLFGLAIPVAFDTWLAVAILAAVVSPSSSRKAAR
jgi:hypothetical protein